MHKDSIAHAIAHKDLLLKYSRIIPRTRGGDTAYTYGHLDRAFGRGEVGSYILKGLNGKLGDSKKRANQMGFEFNLDLEYLVSLWLACQGTCSSTGVIMNFDSGSTKDRNPIACSVDRIDSYGGYTKGNVRLLTAWANNAQNTWGDDLFEQMVRAAYQRLSSQILEEPVCPVI